MLENSRRDYSSTCVALMREINDADYKIKSTKANQASIEKYQKTIREMRAVLSGCTEVIRWLKPYTTAVQDYLAERRTNSLQNVNNAIRLANEVIADANIGARFNIEGKDAWLSTSDDLDLQLTEGGGYRNITSMFLRLVVLGANRELLDTVILDEVAAAVSPENSTTLSSYLNLLGQTMQIISIEQKPEMYANIDNVTVYRFEKDDEYSRVICVKSNKGDEQRDS